MMRVVAQLQAALFRIIPALALAALVCVAAPVRADMRDAALQGSNGAAVTPKMNAMLPLDAELVDDAGAIVKLGDFFDGKKPVILTLVYYSCPNLCTTELNNLVETLKNPQMKLQLGQQYSIVTLSFSDIDTPALAHTKKLNYLNALDQAGQQHSWQFLTGKPDQVKRVADSVGFGYVKDMAKGGQYLHGSAIFICTPNGHVSRTIQDVYYPPDELRDSLINASEGKMGSPIFRLALTCGLVGFNSGKYTWLALGIVRAAAFATILLMSAFIGVLLLRERRARAAGGMGPNTRPRIA
jgi:protein SCO1